MPANMPRILAHRGQAERENTIYAFERALVAGADYIETDIQCSSDSVAVIFHDSDLRRVAGIDKKVSEFAFAQLQQLGFCSLEQALVALPDAKFNIDFKSERAILPGLQAISNTGSFNRVLAASFSARRLRKVRRLAPKIAQSLPSSKVLAIYLLPFFAKLLAKGFVAAQIPVSFGILKFDSARFIELLHSANLEVHFWVINSTVEADRLLSLGADGFVTDETALLVQHLRKS